MPKHQNQTAGLGLEELQDLLEEKRAELPYGYKLPYMQWYEDDFKSSDGVSEMSPLGRLMYRQLLAKAWVSKQAPYLPSDPRKLQRLADCPTDEDWVECGLEILEMFQTTDDGERLFHPRQLTNYLTQLIKISACIANGSQGGRPRKPKETQEKPRGYFPESHLELEPDLEPELESELKPNPETGEDETDFSEQDGQDDMKAKKEIPAICLGILNQKAEGYRWDEIADLEKAHSSGAVVRDFREWAEENSGDEFRPGPISAYLRVAQSRLSDGGTSVRAAVKDPEVGQLVRTLSRLSGGTVDFLDKHRARLAEVMKEFTAEEITAGFKTWIDLQDLNDAKNIGYLAGKFAQVADLKADAVRADRIEKAKESTARESAKLRLQEEAEAERAAAEVAKQAEDQLFDPLA